MAICDDCFEEFLHPLVHEAMEKNNQFQEKYGLHARWNWDDKQSLLIFSDPERPTLYIQVSIVGTTEGSSWEWSWANSNLKPHTKRDMEKVRDFGEANGYDKLTTAFLDADEFTGWEMTAIAVHILEAPGSYRFPTEKGYCYLIFREILESTNFVKPLHGAMHGTVQIASGVDLTAPTGEVWKAESNPMND
jgi:hypothetical protein